MAELSVDTVTSTKLTDSGIKNPGKMPGGNFASLLQAPNPVKSKEQSGGNNDNPKLHQKNPKESQNTSSFIKNTQTVEDANLNNQSNNDAREARGETASANHSEQQKTSKDAVAEQKQVREQREQEASKETNDLQETGDSQAGAENSQEITLPAQLNAQADIATQTIPQDTSSVEIQQEQIHSTITDANEPVLLSNEPQSQYTFVHICETTNMNSLNEEELNLSRDDKTGKQTQDNEQLKELNTQADSSVGRKDSKRKEKDDEVNNSSIPISSIQVVNVLPLTNEETTINENESSIDNVVGTSTQDSSFITSNNSQNFEINNFQSEGSNQSDVATNINVDSTLPPQNNAAPIQQAAVSDNFDQELAQKERQNIKNTSTNYDRKTNTTSQESSNSLQVNNLSENPLNAKSDLTDTGSFEQDQQNLRQEGNNPTFTVTTNNGNQLAITFKEMPSPSAQQAERVLSPSEQITMAVREGKEKGSNHISVSLSPEGLGQVNIEIQSTNGKQTINITTTNQETLRLLIQDARQLENAISSITDSDASLNFNLQDGQGGSNFYQPAEQGFAAINDISNTNNFTNNSANYQVSITPLQQVDLENGKVNIIA